MRSANLAELKEKAGSAGEIGAICAVAKFDRPEIEEGLKAADYTIEYDVRNVVTQCNVHDSEGTLVASGTSENKTDALLHAMLGAVREGR